MLTTAARQAAAAAVATVTMTAGLVLTASAARADSTLDPEPRALSAGCHVYPVDFTVDEPGAASWELEVSAYTPAGEYSTGFFTYGRGASATGAESLFLCGYEGAGRWRLEGTLVALDRSGEELTTETMTAELRLTRMATRTGVQATDTAPAPGAVIDLQVTSRQREKSGWKANREDEAALYARCGTEAWRRLPAKRLTGAAGRVTTQVRYDTAQPCRVRAHTLPASDARASWSKVVRLRPRGSSAAASSARPGNDVPGIS